jgi:hypothetical protein
MKTRMLVRLLGMTVLIVTLMTPTLAIQVCYDYVSYRLTGIDPAPPGRPQNPYLSYDLLTESLKKKNYAPLSQQPAGHQLQKGDVIFLPGHVGIANGPDDIDHFIIVWGTSTKSVRYAPTSLPNFDSKSGLVGGRYLHDTLKQFRMRQFSAQRSGTPSNYVVWRQKGHYVKGRLLAGPVRIPAKNSTPTDVGIVLEMGKAYFVVGQGICSLWDGQHDGCDSVYRYRTPMEANGGPLKVWGQLKLINPTVHLSQLIEQQTRKPPVYNPSHTYEGLVRGEGKPLKAVVYDGGGYGDNHGQLQVSVYEAVKAR